MFSLCWANLDLALGGAGLDPFAILKPLLVLAAADCHLSEVVRGDNGHK